MVNATSNPYSLAPEQWCLAEFMATLPTVGENARRYLTERGYVIDILPQTLPEKSTLESNGLRTNY